MNYQNKYVVVCLLAIATFLFRGLVPASLGSIRAITRCGVGFLGPWRPGGDVYQLRDNRGRRRQPHPRVHECRLHDCGQYAPCDRRGRSLGARCLPQHV